MVMSFFVWNDKIKEEIYFVIFYIVECLFYCSVLVGVWMFIVDIENLFNEIVLEKFKFRKRL